MKSKSLFSIFADNRNKDSFASKSRNKRFNFFRELIKNIPLPIKILDIGGTEGFWEMMGFTEEEGVEIYLLNLEKKIIKYSNFRSVKGDATNLREFENKSFDIVFSNSVIEHLFTFENQVRMAQEAVRVGKNYFIQTPNYWFPIEPHFVFPGFQFLPTSVKRHLMTRYDLGHFQKFESIDDANNIINEIRLLSKSEMRTLFPDAEIYLDKFLGLNKSFIAYNFDYANMEFETRRDDVKSGRRVSDLYIS